MEFNFGLYPVITEAYCGGRTALEVLKEVVAGGAKIVQMREKLGSGPYPGKRDLHRLALEFRRITAGAGVVLIINDHVDIALAVGADGVHLGQEDLPCSVVRKMAPELVIGVSTHNDEEIREAEREGASWINIGPIYATQTKTLSMAPLGIDYLKAAEPRLPFSVMGGVKRDKIPELVKAGAKNIAMVTEITQAEDIKGRVEELNRLIRESQTV